MNSVICLATEPSQKAAIDVTSKKNLEINSHFMDDAASCSVGNGIQNCSSIHKNKRRSYAFNETSGQMERIIRKRKRKTTSQLEELASAFDTEPHWSKETLAEISKKTSLTEAQVYKWGWD